MIKKLLLFSFLLTSCATPYFNYYYNAETKFKQGKEKYIESLQAGLLEETVFKSPELESAITKCEMILERFGDDDKNEYADDAYIMIAQASYYLGLYEKAIQAATLLKDKVPNSPKVSEANLLLGDALIKQNKPKEAQRIYQEIPLQLQNVEIVAQSKLSTARLLLSEGNREKAEEVLIATIAYDKNTEEVEYNEPVKYELLKNLISIYEEDKAFNKIVVHSEDILDFEVIEYKKYFVEKRLDALEHLNQTDLYLELVEKVEEDSDFDLERDFKGYLSIKRLSFSKDTTNLISEITDYPLEYKRSPYEPFVNLIAVEYLITDNRLDSALALYSPTVRKLKNKEQRDYHQNEFSKLQSFNVLYKKENELNKTIRYETTRLDSLSEFMTDSVKSVKEADVKKVLNQKSENDYLFAEHYVKYNDYNTAKPYFESYAKTGGDTAKQVTSYLHLAYFEERNNNKPVADSIYAYVYKNYSSYQTNEELLEKLGIEKANTKISKSEALYASLINTIDLNKVSYAAFYPKYASVIPMLDTTSVEFEKLSYLNTKFLIEEPERQTDAIEQLKWFREKFPRSEFQKEFQTILTDSSLINSAPKTEETEGTILETEIPEAYFGPPATYEIEVEVNDDGSVNDVQILTEGNEKDKEQFAKRRVFNIVKNWKFNSSEKKNRFFKTTINFSRDVEPDENNIELE